MPDNDKANAYVSWITFKNAIDGFGQGLPNRVDRSVFPGLAGGVQYQLIAALRFFRLVEEDGRPTPALRALAVPDEAERKKQLGALFRERYPLLFALDLTKTTPAELDEKMTEATGLTGTTRTKAVRFFLAGARYLDIPVSPLLAKKQPTNGGGVPRKHRPRRPPKPAPAPVPAASGAPVGGTWKTINLKRGETVTLSATADFFAMEPDDRDFLFGIVKQLEDYERKVGASIPSGQSQTDQGGEE
jgi:hypothetical protein